MSNEKSDTDAWPESIEQDPDVEAKDASDLRRIGEALGGVQRADTELVEAVAAAKAAGRSWTEIANVLGVSRQAARQRFDALTKPTPTINRR
ncbi:ECF sigma factor [Jatrophihabitans endophyticus]|uniref:ECF sigma factor n=1 Tax=Jatrophihabitans endophyticus TaxID=1206085 RepID=A0A1M5CSC3_9ACTN|nr:ECF-type sigma factor [Jatrophihabitans endophyticus]SHF57643.1 ECF sigma factor [Jatrophihabitans endophyticus]